MKALDFFGRDSESDALLFKDSEGNEYAVPLTDTLVAAVFRSTNGTPQSESGTPLAPREIQALLRSGLTADQVAEQTGTPIERIQRFEGPVLAEIARAVDRVQNSPLGSDIGAPRLGDLVLDRLAQVGADPEEISWNASRKASGAWEVTAAYVQSGVQKSASWTLPDNSNSAMALDENARDLTEVERSPEPIRALFPPVALASLDHAVIESEDLLARQESILARLDAARGKRQPVVIDGEGLNDEVENLVIETGESDSEASSSDKQNAWSALLDAAKPGTSPAEVEEESRPRIEGAKAVGAPGVTEGQEEPSAPATTVLPAPEPSKSRRRTPVPSWDEIVFGSRSE